MHFVRPETQTIRSDQVTRFAETVGANGLTRTDNAQREAKSVETVLNTIISREYVVSPDKNEAKNRIKDVTKQTFDLLTPQCQTMTANQETRINIVMLLKTKTVGIQLQN